MLYRSVNWVKIGGKSPCTHLPWVLKDNHMFNEAFEYVRMLSHDHHLARIPPFNMKRQKIKGKKFKNVFASAFVFASNPRFSGKGLALVLRFQAIVKHRDRASRAILLRPRSIKLLPRGLCTHTAHHDTCRSGRIITRRRLTLDSHLVPKGHLSEGKSAHQRR